MMYADPTCDASAQPDLISAQFTPEVIVCRQITDDEKVSTGEFHGRCDCCGDRFSFQFAEVSDDGEGDCPNCRNVIDVEVVR